MAIIDKPSDYFETLIYSGNASNPRTLSGLDFQPDWVWLKNRTDGNGHTLADSVRGANKTLSSDGTGAEVTDKNDGHLDAFTSDGFTVGAGSTGDGRVNDGSHTYVSWNWKAETSFTNDASGTGIGSIDSTGSVNETAGFSIVTYTAAGAVATIKHGLSSAPKMIFTKKLNGSPNWGVYYGDATDYLELNTTAATQDDVNMWNDTAPTSSVFSVGGDNKSSGSGNYVAYCFAEKQGYSKFGSYVGNGSTDGTFVYTGFKPAWVMTKISSGTGQWGIADNKRGVAPSGEFLFADSSGATNSAPNNFDFLSNGFKSRADYAANNTSGATYIYMAFAENPFVTSTGVPATAR